MMSMVMTRTSTPFYDKVVLLDHSPCSVVVSHLRFVLDTLRSHRKSQRVDRFVEVIIGRSDVRNHDRLRVTAQTILQETSQLGITIRLRGRNEGRKTKR